MQFTNLQLQAIQKVQWPYNKTNANLPIFLQFAQDECGEEIELQELNLSQNVFDTEQLLGNIEADTE